MKKEIRGVTRCHMQRTALGDNRAPSGIHMRKPIKTFRQTSKVKTTTHPLRRWTQAWPGPWPCFTLFFNVFHSFCSFFGRSSITAHCCTVQPSEAGCHSLHHPTARAFIILHYTCQGLQALPNAARAITQIRDFKAACQ